MAHFSVASLTQVVWLLVFIFWTPSSTGAAFSLEEEFLQLKENYIQMKQLFELTAIEQQGKMTQLEAQLELNNELRQELALKVTQLEAKNVQMEVKIEKLEAKIELQDSLLTSFLREKNERTAATDFNSDPMSNNQSAFAIPGLPSSCEDLKIIGHALNGFYSVIGSAKMESVYCDFTKLPDDAGFQKFIGYVDVKSVPVYFYVTRNSNFGTESTPIPFDVAVVNEGNAMDLASGKFTAPRPGIYYFSFTGSASLESSTNYFFDSYFYLNGNQIATGGFAEYNPPVYQFSPVTLHLTLNLKTGDQVWMEIYYTGSSSYLVDNREYNYTHFTGFMLEEEIVLASL